MKAKEGDLDNNDYFSPQYTNLWRISHNWRASWFAANSNGALTVEMEYDYSHTIKGAHMPRFPGANRLRWHFAEDLVEQNIASWVFSKHARDLGRWGFVADDLNQDGSTSWARLGLYELSWRKGSASAIKHMPSGLTGAVPPDGVSHIEAAIWSPHLDCVAAANGRIQDVPLWKDFDVSVGRNEHSSDPEANILQEMGNQLELQIQCQEGANANGEGP